MKLVQKKAGIGKTGSDLQENEGFSKHRPKNRDWRDGGDPARPGTETPNQIQTKHMKIRSTSKFTASLIAAGAIVLILASGGNVYAQKVKIPNRSIKASKLANRSVTAPKIADGAVTTSKLADGSVTEPKLADGSVTMSKLDPSITPWLADGANVYWLGNVGIGVDNPTAPLDVDGDIKSHGKSVPVAEETLRIVRGTFGGGGEALAGGGTGYTSVRNSTGVYTVTFTVPFSAAPTITVTPSSPNASMPVAFASVASRSATGFVLAIRRATTGDPEDWHSNFIAIGSR